MKFFHTLLRIYRKHFSQFLFFRILRVFFGGIYKHIYHMVACLLNRNGTKEYKLKSFETLLFDKMTVSSMLDPGKTIQIPSPCCFEKGKISVLNRHEYLTVDMPAIHVYSKPSVMPVSGTDFLLSDQCALHHDFFRPEKDTCKAETYGVVSINSKKKTIRTHLLNPVKEQDSGLVLFGQNTQNYAHWLIETLPKLVIFNQMFPSLSKSVAILIENDLHPNIYDSLDKTNVYNLDVVKIKRWTPVFLNHAVFVSNPGYEPYIPQKLSHEIDVHYTNSYSFFAFDQLRQHFWNLSHKTGYQDQKKIYLRRDPKSNNARLPRNPDEIENLLRVNGFLIVNPMSLSFMEQVILFRNADVIVTSAGATLANMIFAQPGTRILVLASRSEVANYFVFSNLAGILGHELYYILGEIDNKRKHPLHRDFYVSLPELEAAIKTI